MNIVLTVFPEVAAKELLNMHPDPSSWTLQILESFKEFTSYGIRSYNFGQDRMGKVLTGQNALDALGINSISEVSDATRTNWPSVKSSTKYDIVSINGKEMVVKKAGT